MTKLEAAIITAYTGILIGNAENFHSYARDLMGEPMDPMELSNPELWKLIKKLSKPDFLALKIDDK